MIPRIMIVVRTQTMEPTARPKRLLRIPQPPHHPAGHASVRETQTVIGHVIATVRIPIRT
jgi:hypothetical protein